MEKIAEQGHIHFDEVPPEVQDTFRTSHDITPEWHVRMQAAFQEHVDSAISKTTNFAREATRTDVRKIYELAFETGCKGVTVYRDGSRPMQVLSTGRTGQEEGAGAASSEETEELGQQLADARERAHKLEGVIDELKSQLEEHDREAAAARHKRQRPSILRGRTIKMDCPLGDLYVTVNEDEHGRPFEVFCTVGKAGGAAMADSEAIGRLISLALRSVSRSRPSRASCGASPATGGGRRAAEGAVGSGRDRAGAGALPRREGGGAGGDAAAGVGRGCRGDGW